ncbi:MAG: T9SS type A sorting domain-containing protein, partial [Bacteroidia bacterium]
TSTTNSKAITGLTAGATYNYQVQAVCSTGSSAYSTASSFTTTTATTSCTDNYESNNTASTSKSIAVNTNITARIGTSTDVDWFHFSTASTAPKVKVTLTNLPADYDVILYASNGTTQLGISQNGSTTAEAIIYNSSSAAATYRVKVYGYGGAFNSTACYTLNASRSATNFVRLAGEEEDGIKALTEVMNIYPNPAADLATIVFTAQEDAPVEFMVFDAMGRAVRVPMTQGDNKDEMVLNLSEVNNGIYFVRATNGNVTETKRLVVAH